MIGVAMVGGAPDGRSDGYNLGWRDGMTGPDKSAQGAKLPALDPGFVPVDSPVGVSRFVMTVLSTPSRLPLGVYQIGPVLLATLPGEFTTVMGVRIQSALAEAMAAQGRPVERVILVGLANEYLSYFTTPEEYALQFYEGASTAYGPISGPLVQDRLTLLARQFSEAPASQLETIEYSPGPPVQFGLCDVGTPAPSREGLAGILQDDAGRPLPDAPTFCWSDRFPILPLPYDPARRVTPRVAIEVRRGTGSWAVLRESAGDPENDRGLNFVTTASAPFPLRSEWCVTWLGRLPAGSDLEARFNVTTLRGETLHAPVKPFAPPP
jgi:neutral ceramidase